MAKGKGFFGEFKEFVMRGNVMDLAVGVIIGGAFKAIVDSLVADVLMPAISLITGGLDFSNLFINLSDDVDYPTLAAAQEAGAATLNYGNFISAIITFLIMAFVIFMIVKSLNKIAQAGKKFKKEVEAPAEAPTTKECPYCKSTISIDAVKCPNCTSDLS